MIPQRLRKFISDLQKATDNNDVLWEEGASDAFFCRRNNMTLHIGHQSDGDTGDEGFIFKLLAKGKKSVFYVGHGDDDYRTMGDLYSAVSVNAQKVDDLIADFFKP